LRYTPNGTAVTNLRIAVNRKFKDRTGELKEDTCFITVTAWDKQAEICNQYLQKGRAVFVEGILQSRSWETGDGQKRSTIDVRAERIQFLNGPVKNENAAGSEPAVKDAGDQDTVISPEDIAWEE
jgi:single-strand DNA-binding protein